MTYLTRENSAGSIYMPSQFPAEIYSDELKLRYSEHIPSQASHSSGVVEEWIDIKQDTIVVEFNLQTPRSEESGGGVIICKCRLWNKYDLSPILHDGSEEFTTQFKPGEDGRKSLVIKNFDNVHRNPDTGRPSCLYSIWLDSEDVNAEVSVTVWA